MLLACAHGTDDPQGRRAVADLVDRVARARPRLQVEPAFLDVQQPTLDDVLAVIGEAGRAAVVVPLLLSAGYHVHVDIADSVRAAAGPAVAAGALGPDPALVEVLVDRLVRSGATPQDAVVLTAAGSSDARAVRDVAELSASLAQMWGGQVSTGFLSAASPAVEQAVDVARTAGADRVVVASYLLAPGFFHRRLSSVGADLVTGPLLSADAGADPRLVELVLRRYDDGRQRAQSA